MVAVDSTISEIGSNDNNICVKNSPASRTHKPQIKKTLKRLQSSGVESV